MNISLKDLALYLKKEKALVISDTHLGFEESLNKQGILVPRFQYEETIKRLKQIFKDLEIKEIIVNGDFKHEFGEISRTEWKDSLNMIDFFLENCKKLTLIKGNHDKIIDPIASRRNLKPVLGYKINDSYICHGDFIPNDFEFHEAKNIIIGHEHPAISLRKSGRVETYKCFLIGKWKRKNLYVMPSFNLVIEGTNILKEKLLSPFLKQDLKNFHVFIVEDKIYDFGRLKDI